MIKTYIVIKGMRLNYIDEGQGNTVLLLHGWGSSVDAYRGVINALSDCIRFVALDFPGCGKSDMPDSPLTTEDYAEIVLEFIKKLNITDYSIVGHSHGGRVIMKLAGTKRIAPRRIVFIDAAGIKPRRSLKKDIKVATYKTVRKVLTLPVIKNYTEETLKKARNYFGSADYNSAPEVMKKTLVNLVNDDMTPLLSGIDCPTLLIWGDKDTATPLYMAHIIEQKVADTGLCILSGTGHFSFVEKPAQAAAILKSFLA